MKSVEIVTNIVLVMMLVSHILALVDAVKGEQGENNYINSIYSLVSIVIPPSSGTPNRKSVNIGMIVYHVLMSLAIGYLLFKRSYFKFSSSYKVTTALFCVTMIALLVLSVMGSYFINKTRIWDANNNTVKARLAAMNGSLYAMTAGFLALVIVRSK